MYRHPKDLWIVLLARHIAGEIAASVKTWPKLDQWNIGQQLIRSADSVSLNIGEGQGRQTLRDRIRFLHFARGSLEETIEAIRKALGRRLIEEGRGRTWLLQCFRLSKSLNAFISVQYTKAAPPPPSRNHPPRRNHLP